MSNNPKTTKVDIEKFINSYMKNHKRDAKCRNDNSTDYLNIMETENKFTLSLTKEQWEENNLFNMART